MRATDEIMRTAPAYNERAPSRSAHKLAEKLAKNAGVDFDEWIGEAIAEYAEDLGVAPHDLSERERLEAIEDRIDRHARAAPAPRRASEPEPAPAPRLRRESVRTAPESELRPRPRFERDLFDDEATPPARPLPRAPATDRLERTIQDIERRAERNEERTAKALESLTELVASRGFEGSRLEGAVADIEKRAQRNEERTATAIESLQHLVASRGGERERLVQAVAEVETRAQRNSVRTANALESISQMVASRDVERERLEAAVERANKRNDESEARAARAFESLSAMVAKSAERRPPPAPVERPRAPVAQAPSDPVADRLGQLSRRVVAARPAAPAPRVAGDEDDEALALVSERLARRRRLKGEAPSRPLAPPAPELADAFGDLRRDLRLLADKVDQLSDGAVGAGALEALRAQTREVERALVMAGEKVAGADRMQTQMSGLAEQVERLAAAQPASAEMAAALKALADAHARSERDDPVKALKAVERQLDDLGARVEAAARRPAHDARAMEDLTRRIEAVRAAVERQGRPDTSEFVAALGALNDKLDHAAASGSQSAAQISALGAMVARLEEQARRPAAVSLDAKPIEDLARRIEAVRAAVERQGRPDTGEFVAALGALNDKLDHAAASGTQSAAHLSALSAMVARLEEQARRPTSVSLDPRPIEDLARRIEGLHGGLAPKVDDLRAALDTLARKLDRPTTSPAEAARFEAALADIRVRLDRPTTTPAEAARLEEQLADIRARLDRPAFAPQMEAVEAALRRMAARVEETAARAAPAPFDSQPLEDLVRRIDGAHGRLGPKVDDIHTALGELSARIERPSRTAAEIARIEEALRRLGAQVETALARPGAFDPQALEALAQRIDAVRGEADAALSPHVARLEAGLSEIRARLDRPAYVPQIEAVDATLRRLAAKFEEAAARPTTVSLDARPIEDLARRIESVRASFESAPSFAPQVERLETALGVVSDKLDRAAAPVDAQGINATLAQMNRRLEEAFRRPPEFEREQIDALSAQVEVVRETVERQTQHFGGAEAALREAVERIERPSAAAPELIVLVNAVKALATKIERVSGFDQARFETMFADWVERLGRQSGAAVSVKPLADAVAALGDRIDRMRPGEEPALHASIADLLDRLDGLAGRDSRLEGVLRDVGERLSGVEHRLSSPSTGGDNWAHVEFAVRDLTEKVADLRAASDTRAVAQDVRALHEKIDDLAEISLRPAPAAAPVNHDALIEPLLDIQERLDKLASLRATPPALDDALSDFADQMDALRAAREEASREAATVADLRADHATFDRRMDARFSGVQDVLERLVDRITRLEREPASDARAPVAAPMSFSTRPALPDIPDRETPLRAPAPAPETPVIAPPPPRLREETAAAKSAVLNAHIAAARRKASAVAESEERETSGPVSGAAQAFAQRAHALLSVNSRPVLLGAAGALTLLTSIAAYELRGHAPVHKSEIEEPVSPPTSLGEASPVDETPTGAIASAPKVISAPLPAPSPAVSPTPAAPAPAAALAALAPSASPQARKPAQALVAAVPAGVGAALVSAAASGDLGAEVEIAQRYLEGRTVPRDPKVAADWLQAAADGGSPFAHYRLGALYEKGVGVARDAARARALYTKAADAGNARAMHNLAVLYAQDGGQGKPDYPVALDWFRRAGAYGVRDSQFNLGVLYGRGLGATQDLAQSWLWFSLAAKQGDTDAAHKRDEVAIRMDAKTMGAAKKLLEDFKIKTPDPAVNDAPPAPPAAADAAPARKEIKTPV